VEAEAADRDAGLDAGAARPRKFKGEDAGLEPAITLAEACVDDVRRQVGKAPPRRRAVQKLDVRQSPAALGGNQSLLGASTVIGARDEKVSLVPKPDINALLEVVEECHALPDQLDLLEVVELQPESPGGDRRRQRCQRGTLLEDDCFQSGALREVGGGAADDAAADDDEVGGIGR
jgi:hypothetical protein